MDDAPGEFAGTARYAIERRLGQGGMGVVYRVHDRERDGHVALKVLPRTDPAALIRFKREFRSLASIVHPNLVSLYELVADGDRWFFTMEAVDGIDFLRWTRPADADFDRIRSAMIQLVHGVEAIHAAGRLHRDLKPPNVMVRPDGTVVILDFGLISELGSRQDGDLAGTAAYMAPEQWTDAPLTAACDWYGAGVMLFQALTGALPFGGNPSAMLQLKLGTDAPHPSQVRAGIPPDLDELCRDLLHRNPEARPTGTQILARLSGISTPPPLSRFLAFSLSRSAAALPSGEGLVGRERQLRQLVDAYTAVLDGSTVTAHVSGASGSGKSELVRRFLSGLSGSADTAVLSGRCFEQESVPYKALDSLVDTLSEFLVALPPADVAPLIPVQAAVLARVFPVLQNVPAIATAPSAGHRISDPRELRRAAVSALREMLTRIGQRRHLVLTIDDLQWGDQDSAAVIVELLAPPDPPRLLLVLSYRSEHVERSPCLAALTAPSSSGEAWQRRVDIPLDSLDETEGAALARELLQGVPGINESDFVRIARESGGNPYFIHELCRHASSRDERKGSAPVELDAVLWERVQRLPGPARDLLAIVAVAGQPLALRHLLDTAPDASGLQHALAVLRAEHLLRSTGPGLGDDVETYHDRVRESVMHRLPPETVRNHHAGLARVLSADLDADAETVAEHFDGAGDPGRAGRYFIIGAQRAAAALAFDRAARLYRRALERSSGDPSRDSELQRELGDALANAGRGFEAAQAYQGAVAHAPASERFELERLAAQQYCISGHVREGRVIFRRLLAAAHLSMPSHPAAVIATLLSRRFRLRLRGPGFTERPADQVPVDVLRRIDLTWSIAAGLSVPDAIAVASLQTKGLMLALDAGEPYRLVRALAFEAFLTGASGMKASPRAAALMATAERLADRLDNPHGIGVVLAMQGMLAHIQARFQDAKEHAIAAEEILRTRCSGVSWEIALARTVITWACWHMGECEDLRRRNAIYLAEAKDRGDMFLVTNLRSVVTPFLYLLDDDPDGASAELTDAMAGWPREGFDLQHANEAFFVANILIYRGDGAAAIAAVDSRWGALRRSLQLATQLVRLNFVDLRARAALAAAERATHREPLLRRAERDARRLMREDTTLSRPYAHCLFAGVASLRGQRDSTLEHLHAAMHGADQVHDGFRAVAVRYRLGQLLDGERGAGFRLAAREQMTRDGIRNAERVAGLYVPGFVGI